MASMENQIIYLIEKQTRCIASLYRKIRKFYVLNKYPISRVSYLQKTKCVGRVSKEIKIIYDREADVLAIIFDEDLKNRDFIEPTPSWFIWFDENKNVRMIEIFRASKFLSKLRTIKLEDKSDLL